MTIQLDITRDYPAQPYPKTNLNPAQWHRGIVVRMPNHLGDAVMALPALRQLKRMLPEPLKLMVITPIQLKQFYSALPWVDEFLYLSSPHRRWTASELAGLRQMRPDVGILFNHSFRDAFYLLRAGIPQRFGSDRRCKSLLLTRAFALPRRPRNRPAEVHQSRRLLAMVEALGAPGWNGALPEVSVPALPDSASPALRRFCSERKLMLLAPGAAYGAAKRYPAESFRTVAAHHLDQGGTAAIVGSFAEREIGEAVLQGLDSEKIHNFCGETDLIAVMHLLNRAAVTVSNDSGIMHLGALLNRPGVAVFGPTDLTATGPISPRWKLVKTELDCGPCFKRICPHNDPQCMKSITPDEVILAIEAILAASDRS